MMCFFSGGKGGDCLRFSERKVLCTVEDNLIYRLYIKKFQKVSKSFDTSNMGWAKKLSPQFMLTKYSVTAFLQSMVIKFTMPASVYRDECLKWTSYDWLRRCWETTETEELSDSLMCQFDLKCQTKNHFYFFLSNKKQYAVNEKKTLLNNICCIHICL